MYALPFDTVILQKFRTRMAKHSLAMQHFPRINPVYSLLSRAFRLAKSSIILLTSSFRATAFLSTKSQIAGLAA